MSDPNPQHQPDKSHGWDDNPLDQDLVIFANLSHVHLNARSLCITMLRKSQCFRAMINLMPALAADGTANRYLRHEMLVAFVDPILSDRQGDGHVSVPRKAFTAALMSLGNAVLDLMKRDMECAGLLRLDYETKSNCMVWRANGKRRQKALTAAKTKVKATAKKKSLPRP